MNRVKSFALAAIALFIIATEFNYRVEAQTGPRSSIIDPNIASEQELLSLPNFNNTIVQELTRRRPFLSMKSFDDFLLSELRDRAKLNELYKKIFVQLDINQATKEELKLIPWMSANMLNELDDPKDHDFRPYKTLKEFLDKFPFTISEKSRLEKYVFLPIDLNVADRSDILRIPGFRSELLNVFLGYREYKDPDRFCNEVDRELSKQLQVEAADKEVKRLLRYVRLKEVP